MIIEFKEEKWIAPAPRGGWRTALHLRSPPRSCIAPFAGCPVNYTLFRVVSGSAAHGSVVACVALSALPLSRHAT